MSLENSNEKAYLTELYTQTNGDIEHQVSMYDVGTALGLEDEISGEIAQSLFIQGFAELKTLSGGLGITIEGLKVLNVSIPNNAGNNDFALENTKIITPEGTQTIEIILEKIKGTIPQFDLSYDQIEECVIDMKTIETQMLSANPKTEIIKALIRSLHENLSKNVSNDLTDILQSILSA